MSDCRKGTENPNVTTYSEARKIFQFAKATNRDRFYDLGCGYATPCIVAAQKFRMNKIVGIESCKGNFMEAARRIEKEGLSCKIWLRYGCVGIDDIKDATLVYFVLESEFEDVEYFKKNLGIGCKLITPKIPIPSIIPIDWKKIGEWVYFLSKAPLSKYKAKNADEWVRSFSEYNNFKDYIKSLRKDKKWSKGEVIRLQRLMKEIYE